MKIKDIIGILTENSRECFLSEVITRDTVSSFRKNEEILKNVGALNLAKHVIKEVTLQQAMAKKETNIETLKQLGVYDEVVKKIREVSSTGIVNVKEFATFALYYLTVFFKKAIIQYSTDKGPMERIDKESIKKLLENFGDYLINLKITYLSYIDRANPDKPHSGIYDRESHDDPIPKEESVFLKKHIDSRKIFMTLYTLISKTKSTDFVIAQLKTKVLEADFDDFFYRVDFIGALKQLHTMIEDFFGDRTEKFVSKALSAQQLEEYKRLVAS